MIMKHLPFNYIKFRKNYKKSRLIKNLPFLLKIYTNLDVYLKPLPPPLFPLCPLLFPLSLFPLDLPKERLLSPLLKPPLLLLESLFPRFISSFFRGASFLKPLFLGCSESCLPKLFDELSFPPLKPLLDDLSLSFLKPLSLF